MSELFFRITPNGIITQSYICRNCASAKATHSIQGFLIKETVSLLLKEMDQDVNERLIEDIVLENVLHFLYIHKIGNQYLFYLNKRVDQVAKISILNLIRVFADNYMMPDHSQKEETKFLFDNIQKLNNELINRQRETAKLNQEMNRVNKILNSRLVKDPLTKLVSRYQYQDEMLLEIAKHSQDFGLFWFIDIDDFKKINDTYGHLIGDQYLVEIANRLLSLPFEHTIKMRIAGDEFGLFIAGVKDVQKSTIDSLYQTFVSHVFRPIEIEDLTLEFSCSTGIAIFKQDAKDIHELIDLADFAMYQAKEKGKNQYQLFDKDLYNALKS